MRTRWLLILLLTLLYRPAPAGLVAHYEFSNNFLDSSGNHIDGVASAVPSFVDGPPGFGQALWMDNGAYLGGIHYPTLPQHVICGPNPALVVTGPLTVMAWIKWTAPASAEEDVVLVNGTMPYGWRVSRRISANSLKYEFRGRNWGATYGGIPISLDGQWHHYAGVFGGSFFRAYLDGQRLFERTLTSGPLEASDRLYIGGQPDRDVYFSGGIDDVRLYHEALTDTQIQAAMTPIATIRPILRIQRDDLEVILSWPAKAEGFLPERCSVLDLKASWKPVQEPIITVGDEKWVILEMAPENSYFRLKKP